MAKETYLIDVTARFHDQASKGAEKAASRIDRMEESIRRAREQLKRLNSEKWTARLDAVDTASSKISDAIQKANKFAGKTVKLGVSVIDYATKPLKGVLSLAKSVQKLAKSDFVQGLVTEPVGLADSMEDSQASFKRELSESDFVLSVTVKPVIEAPPPYVEKKLLKSDFVQGVMADPVGLADQIKDTQASFKRELSESDFVLNVTVEPAAGSTEEPYLEEKPAKSDFAQSVVTEPAGLADSMEDAQSHLDGETDWMDTLVKTTMVLVESINKVSEFGQNAAWLLKLFSGSGGAAGTSAAGASAAGASAAGVSAAGVTASIGSVALPTVSVAGMAIGMAELESAKADINRGHASLNEKTKQDALWQGGTKTGMVAAGAGIGATIGTFVIPIPVVGTVVGGAIGAGIGGIAGMTAGDDLGKWFSDMSDGTQQLRDVCSDLYESQTGYLRAVDREASVKGLVDEYETLTKKLEEGNLSASERERAQERVNGLVRELKDFYPELISQYDTEQGKLSVSLDTLREKAEYERESYYWVLKRSLLKMEETGDPSEKAEASEKVINENQEKLDRLTPLYTELLNLDAQLQTNSLVQTVALDEARAEGSDNPHAEPRYQDALADREKLFDRYSEIKAEYDGSTPVYGEKNPDAVPRLAGTIYQDIEALQTANAEEEERFLEAKQQVTLQFQAEKAVIEQEAGLDGTIEAEMAKWSELDKAKQESLRGVIEQVLALQRGIKYLPDSVQIDVVLANKLLAPEGNGYVGRGHDVRPFASGGILDKPQLGLVAEAGPEAIIPLSSTQHSRGMELWQEAGKRLGVSDVGESYLPERAERYEPDGTVTVSIGSLGGMSFSFGGDVGNAESVMEMIREQMPEIADELCRTLAEMLQKVFCNMPVVSR